MFRMIVRNPNKDNEIVEIVEHPNPCWTAGKFLQFVEERLTVALREDYRVEMNSNQKKYIIDRTTEEGFYAVQRVL